MLTVFLEECCAASFFFIKNSWPTVVVVSNPMIKAGFKSPNPSRASHAASCPAVDGEHLWLCCAQPLRPFPAAAFAPQAGAFSSLSASEPALLSLLVARVWHRQSNAGAQPGRPGGAGCSGQLHSGPQDRNPEEEILILISCLSGVFFLSAEDICEE